MVDESAHNKGALGSLYAGTGQDLADDAVEVVGVARDDAGEEVPGAAEPADLDDFGDFFHRLGNLCQLPLGDLDIYEGAQWVAQGGWVYSVVESHKVSSIVEAGQSGLHRVAREPYELGDGARADHEWASMPAMSERAALLADLLLRLL